jgi:hypothetical protein
VELLNLLANCRQKHADNADLWIYADKSFLNAKPLHFSAIADFDPQSPLKRWALFNA